MDDFNYVCCLCILDLLHLFVKFKSDPVIVGFKWLLLNVISLAKIKIWIKNYCPFRLLLMKNILANASYISTVVNKIFINVFIHLF